MKLPTNGLPDDRDADGPARLDLGVAASGPGRLREGRPDLLSDPGRPFVGGVLVGRTRLHGHELGIAEESAERLRILIQRGGGRGGLSRTNENLLVDAVPGAHLDRGDLADGRHAGPELQEVLAEYELESHLRAVRPLGGRLRGVGGSVEVEGAVDDAQLEVDLVGQLAQEAPVGLVHLRHVVLDLARGVDRARVQAGIRGYLLGHVRIHDLGEDLRVAAPVQPVGQVVAAYDQERAGL